jgi:succinyl-CoA synthetase beta subunit
VVSERKGLTMATMDLCNGGEMTNAGLEDVGEWSKEVTLFRR